jgi:hypothetical protein
MNTPLKKFIDICLALLVFFLFPLIYFSLKQDAVMNTEVELASSSLLNEIKNRGYLSKEMYDNYQEELVGTGLLYTIDLKHERVVYNPLYRFRTSEEVIEDQNNSYTGSNDYHYYPISTDKPLVNDPVNSGALNTETNASVIAASVNTPASATHSHTDACYQGTKHTHTGSSSSGGGCYGGAGSTTACTLPISFVNTDLGGSGGFYCANDGNWVTINSIYGSYKCAAGHYSTYVLYWYRECSICHDKYTFSNSSSQYNGLTCGKTTSSGYTLNCGKTAGAYYNDNTQVYPICNLFVTSIVPTHAIQTVAIGDPLITTVRASYLDGSQKTVIASSSLVTNNPVHNISDTLTYSYSIEANVYSKTCNITVTVIPRSKICTNIHTYNLNIDGSDPGCPYCKAWLKKLEIVTPTSGNLIIYSGTTLAQNGVTLLATYLDGRTELLTNEYVDNLDMGYIGEQNVTLSYKGLNVLLSVTNRRKLTKCSTCNRMYELYPDGSDPGCPYCASLTPIFTGEISEFYVDIYEDDILKELYEGTGIYYLSKRDYFSIDAKNNGKSLGEKLTSGIYRFSFEGSVRSKQGDYIRETGWQ